MALKTVHKKIQKPRALRILQEVFLRNGYLRMRDEKKAKSLGSHYKKGYEVRLVSKDQSELQLLQTAIYSLDYKVNKAFLKNGRMIQPIYGKEFTMTFKKMKNHKKQK